MIFLINDSLNQIKRRSASMWKSHGIQEIGTWNLHFLKSFPSIRKTVLALLSLDESWQGREGFAWEWNHSCRWFLNISKITILAWIVRLVLKLLYQLHLLGKVLRVGVIEGIIVGSFAEPVGVCSKLVWEIGIIVLHGVLFYVLLGIGWLASQWEISSGVLIGWLYVLISSFESWK